MGLRALVPPRKADWSLPGEPKAYGKTFFLLFYLYCSLKFILYHIMFIYITIFSIYHFYTIFFSSFCLFVSSFLALPPEVNPLSKRKMTVQRNDVDVDEDHA